MGLFFLSAGTILAQDDELEYYGLRECRSCHGRIARNLESSSHALALQNVMDEEDKALILGDFDQGSELRQVLFEGEDGPRAFTAEDIQFALGAGRHAQAYLYESTRNEFLVLPAQWNVIEQVWVPIELANEWPDDAYRFGPNCAGCHTVGLDTEDYRWVDDGVQCEACHGPGSLHVETADDASTRINDEELRAIRAAIFRGGADPQVCGQCHSVGQEPEAGHPYPIQYRPGSGLLDPAVFQLVEQDEPVYWWSSGHAAHANMQFNEWMNSSHASSLDTLSSSNEKRDSCLQCHSGDYRINEALIARHEEGEREGDGPEPLSVDTAQWGIVCTVCHDPHAAPEADGANAASHNDLCVDCHSNPADSDTIHHPVREIVEGIDVISDVEGLPSAHFTAADGPECTDCHMSQIPVATGLRTSHALKLVPPGVADAALPDSCSNCHDNLLPTDLLYLIEDTQDNVRSRLSVAFARLGSVAEPEPESDAHRRYNQVIDILRFVQNEGSLGVHNYAYTDRLLVAAEHTLAELSQGNARIAPTEAPAPTAIASDTALQLAEAGQVVSKGVAPMTIIIIGFAFLVLAVAALAFFRKGQEAEV